MEYRNKSEMDQILAYNNIGLTQSLRGVSTRLMLKQQMVKVSNIEALSAIRRPDFRLRILDKDFTEKEIQRAENILGGSDSK